MRHLRVTGIAILAAVVAALMGCSDASHSASGRSKHHRHAIVVHEYRERVPDGSFWYWYVYAYSTQGDSSVSQRVVSGSAYYYRSATQVTNFSSVPFTRVSGNLPKNVEEELEKSERLPDEKVAEDQEPQEIVNDEAVESPSGNSDTQSVDSPAEAASPSDASSSDSGSDSGSSE
jgi:hypothetical protein